MRHILLTMFIGLLAVFSLAACAPEVGSDDWCAKLNEDPKGDWTVDEVTNYAKFCLLK